jgi:hypothetical protein
MSAGIGTADGPQNGRFGPSCGPFGSPSRSQRHSRARAHSALAVVPSPAAILTSVSNEMLNSPRSTACEPRIIVEYLVEFIIATLDDAVAAFNPTERISDRRSSAFVRKPPRDK